MATGVGWLKRLPKKYRDQLRHVHFASSCNSSLGHTCEGRAESGDALSERITKSLEDEGVILRQGTLLVINNCIEIIR